MKPSRECEEIVITVAVNARFEQRPVFKRGDRQPKVSADTRYTSRKAEPPGTAAVILVFTHGIAPLFVLRRRRAATVLFPPTSRRKSHHLAKHV